MVVRELGEREVIELKTGHRLAEASAEQQVSEVLLQHE